MQQDREHTLSWIGLSSIPGVGRVTFRKLVRIFGSAASVLTASADELLEIGGLSAKVANEILSFPWRERAEVEMDKAAAAAVSIITADEPEFPLSLKSTPDPPLFLYMRGSLLPKDGSDPSSQPRPQKFSGIRRTSAFARVPQSLGNLCPGHR